MQVARVLKNIVATRKHEAYRGKKILIVQPLDRDDRPSGDQVVAVDLVDAGVGDLVLVSSEGRFARDTFGKNAPIRSMIVAILEGVEYEV
jgi:microcompartment protein CcmK/EutM